MRRREALIAAGTAWTGLVLGHALTYLLAYPAGTERHAHLLATGHRWLGPAVLSLGAAVPAVLAATAAGALRAGTSSRARVLSRLAAVQVSAFVAIEIGERGLDAGGALAEPAVVLGVVVQVAVAAAAALVLRALTVAVRAVARRRRQAIRPRRRLPGPRPSFLRAVRTAFLVRTRRRAPPILLPV